MGSLTHWSGWPFLRAASVTWSTLVAATSLEKNPANTFTVQVDLQHDLRGGFPVLVEKLLDHLDDKFHRGVVVVEQHDLEHLRRLGLLRTPLEYNRIPTIGAVRLDDRGFGRCRRLGGLGCHEFILASEIAHCGAQGNWWRERDIQDVPGFCPKRKNRPRPAPGAVSR